MFYFASANFDPFFMLNCVNVHHDNRILDIMDGHEHYLEYNTGPLEHRQAINQR